MRLFLDKKFLDDIIDKKLNSNGSDSILEDIRFHFKLDEIRFLSVQKLEEDKKLSPIFNDSLVS